MIYKYLLLDLPADHEVDDFLPTECDVVRAVLANRGSGANVRQVRATTKASLDSRLPQRAYEDVRFVHIAGHGSRKGMSLIGDVLSWRELAAVLKCFCAPLRRGADRALCLSCCYSASGRRALAANVRDLFTGYYYFDNPKIGYAEAITAWSVFYLQKNAASPLRKIYREDKKGRRAPVDSCQLIRSAVPNSGFTHKRP